MKIKILFISVLLTSCYFLTAKEPGDTLFNPAFLHEVHINFKYAHYWDSLLSKSSSPFLLISEKSQNLHLSPKDFKRNVMSAAIAADDENGDYIPADITIDNTTLKNVGVRFKGFTSLGASPYKKPFRIDFNEFNDTLHYFGIKKFCLNNGLGDASMQREYVCYNLFRKAGIAAPRTSYAKLYLNDVYWGLYLIVEQVDKTFLENNFASGQGNLFKAVSNSDLTYIDNNFQSYSSTIELRTNEDIADGKDFVRLVRTASNYSGNQFIDSIQKIFYVDYFLKVLAIDIITKNWDSFMQHGRNFYLYHEPVSDLFYWIPWDYNFALDGPFSTTDNDTNQCNLDFKLTHDIVGNKVNFKLSFRTANFEYMWLDYGDTTNNYYIDRSTLNLSDEYTFREFSHTYSNKGIYPVTYYAYTPNYECSLENIDHVILIDTTGLCPSVSNMYIPYFSNSAYNQIMQLDSFCCTCQWDNVCTNKLLELMYGMNFNDSQYPIDLRSTKLLIQKILDNNYYRSRYFDIFKFVLDSVFKTEEIIQDINFNTDLIRDAVYADTTYLYSTADFENDISGLCNSYINIDGHNSLGRLIEDRKNGLVEEYKSLNHEASPIDLPVGYHDIVINEIAAEMTDEFGNSSSDWIELYNRTDKIISLKNMYISDDYYDPEKFNFPDNSSIYPDGYIIIWADTKSKKDGYHAGFKLAGTGEEVFLFHNQYGTIDTVQFGQQTQNITYARLPNGDGPFVPLNPTFNSRNIKFSSINESLANSIDLMVYPNPVRNILNYVTKEGAQLQSIEVYNSLGQQMFQCYSAENENKIDFSQFTSGIYLIVIKTAQEQYFARVIKN